MSSSQENPMPEEDVIDWEELYGNLDAGTDAEPPLEAARESPTSAIFHAPLDFDPQFFQFCDHGTPVPFWSQPAMWNDYSNQYQGAGATGTHVAQGTSGAQLVNGLHEEMDVKPFGDAQVLPWCPSSALRRPPPRLSSSYKEAVEVTSTTSAPEAVASSSSGKRASSSSPRPAKKAAGAKADSSSSRELKTDCMALVPVQQPEPGNEDGNEAEAKPVVRKPYLHQLDPDQEPDSKERARIRKAKLCKEYRDKAKAKAICPDCLAVCGGNLQIFQLVKKLLDKHNRRQRHR